MNTYAQNTYSPYLPMAFGALPAMVVTALLVVLMHSLIASDMEYIEEDPIIVTEIIQPDPELTKFETITRPVAPISPETPPKTRTRLFSENLDIGPQFDDFTTPFPMDGQDITIGVGGGGIVAYLKPEPIYPSRLLSRGIEGHVDLAFDVTATGATTNIRVIDSYPANAFERAAISALKKWKYKVPVIDGVSRGQVDMMTRISFAVEG
ncbi:MAG: energy transducer TonB [Halioglobus sp.]